MQVLTTSQDMHVGSGVNTLLHGDNRGASYAHRIEYSVLMHDTISTVIHGCPILVVVQQPYGVFLRLPPETAIRNDR